LRRDQEDLNAEGFRRFEKIQITKPHHPLFLFAQIASVAAKGVFAMPSYCPRLDDSLHQFADQLAAAKDFDALRTAMAALVQSFDLHVFVYLFRTRDRAIIISNYEQEWTSHYLRQRYECVDPVIVRSALTTQPFPWGCDLGHAERSGVQRRLFDEAAQFAIRYGCTIPLISGYGCVAALSFAADDPNRVAFLDRSERISEILRVAAICFHAQVRNRLNAAALLACLTPRERECLHWAAEGKTAWEIGRILGVTRRTAAFHLDNAKVKLGVWTIPQAVAMFAKLI
jgi:DNA-binding CsgD family transcriptional regulator